MIVVAFCFPFLRTGAWFRICPATGWQANLNVPSTYGDHIIYIPDFWLRCERYWVMQF